MSSDIYRALQQRLDGYSVGFPPTESGVELKILRKLFSANDADIFLALTQKLEPPASFAARVGLPADEAARKLDDMAERGLLFRVRKGDAAQYAAIPFVHGVMEFQVASLDKELAELVEEYHEEAFFKAMTKSAAAFLRTVPVNRSVETQRHVASYEDAVHIIRQKDKIVLVDCICRKQKNLVHDHCAKPLEVCYMFGSMGQFYLDRGIGRLVDQDEAVRVLLEAQEAGLVTQPATAQNPGGMCNCCGDCCGVLRALNKHPKPAEMVFSNHFAQVDEDLCTGCETCLDRCQMGAIAMNDDGLARIDLDRCIGCGLCVITCPTDALSLSPKKDGAFQAPPAGTKEQMLFMAQRRGLL
ncbi:MAG: 4Fe-4S binding protein [Pseudomonadota bacterium]